MFLNKPMHALAFGAVVVLLAVELTGDRSSPVAALVTEHHASPAQAAPPAPPLPAAELAVPVWEADDSHADMADNLAEIPLSVPDDDAARQETAPVAAGSGPSRTGAGGNSFERDMQRALSQVP